MNGTINYVSGGKLGDFIHALMVVKQNYIKYGKKGNVYLASGGFDGDGFSYGAKKVLLDTKDLILSQDYINTYDVYNNQRIDINLNKWRHSGFLYSKCWIEMLSETFKVDPITTNWLSYKKVSDYENYTIIHRSFHRHNDKFPWGEVIEKENCLFISTNDAFAQSFKSKYSVESIVVDTVSELALVINSGKKYVGNMTGITALAHALGKPRLIELTNLDQVHYINDDKYLKNFWYVKDYQSVIPQDFFK